jgi:hypothetical protein
MFKKLKEWLGISSEEAEAEKKNLQEILLVQKELSHVLQNYGMQRKEQQDKRYSSPGTSDRIEYEAQWKVLTATLVHSMELIRTKALSLDPSEDRDIFIVQLEDMIKVRRQELAERQQIMDGFHEVMAKEAQIKATLDHIDEMRRTLERMPYENATQIYELAKKRGLEPIKMLKDFAKHTNGRIDYIKDIEPLLPRLKKEWEDKKQMLQTEKNAEMKSVVNKKKLN